jgi:hypothetical protein
MKLITAQPDQQYFLWQLQVQLTNLKQYDLERDCVVLIGVEGEPSDLAKHIARNTPAQVVFLPDKRRVRTYAPSIQPHLYAQYVEMYPDVGCSMLLDSDVIFRSTPELIEAPPGVCRVSDTIGYIGYDYIISKGSRQFLDLCAIVGIDPTLVKARQSSSGGAQWVIPHLMTPAFWTKVERDSVTLYDYMCGTNKTWTGEGYPIQAWTAGMWSILWNFWLAGYTTEITPEMKFAWASDTLDKAGDTPMLHIAGVVSDMKNTHFYKGGYVSIHPFNDTSLHVDEIKNASHIYVAEILRARKEWAEERTS